MKSKDQRNDGQLLAAAGKGDEHAFATLYHRYAGRLYAYFFPRCGEDNNLAEDLRQQVFLQLLESKAFREAKKGRSKPDLSPLLFSIAANLLKNTYRNLERKKRKESNYIQMYGADFTKTDTVDPSIIQAAMRELSKEQALCLQLRFNRGLSIAEIAEALDAPTGTIKSRLHYGLKHLAQLLKSSEVH